jgi:putative transposase
LIPSRRATASDRGAAYTSLAFSQRVAELEVDQSFGSTGDCDDNAAVEAFWATLKRELAWIHNTTTWQNRAELRSALFDYIEGFYNPNRTQRRLGHQSPADYEQHAAA